jgi:hypothetical protein
MFFFFFYKNPPEPGRKKKQGSRPREINGAEQYVMMGRIENARRVGIGVV